jgi:hypothetical protein
MDLTALSFLVGTWKTEGRVLADDETPATLFSGTDTYEWVLHNQFIVHKVDVTMGDTKVEAVEYIGEFDKTGQAVKLHSFDNQGNYTLMHGQLDKTRRLNITGDKMRATLSVVNEHEMQATWEKSADNKTWLPWMELKLTKS